MAIPYRWDKNTGEYVYSPKTLRVYTSGLLNTYQATSDRKGKYHRLTCSVDLRVERGNGSNVNASFASIHYAKDGPLYFIPDNSHDAIGFTRADGAALSQTVPVSISLVDYESADTDVPVETLIDYSQGTFARGSGGTYFTSESTIAYALANEIRLENRGDSVAGIPLLEGAGTNYVQYSDDFANWTPSYGTNTSFDAQGPDGVISAGHLTMTTGSGDPYRLNCYRTDMVGSSPTVPMSVSVWAKAASSAGLGRRLRFGAGLDGVAATINPTDTWVRWEGSRTVATSFVVAFLGGLNWPVPGDPMYEIWDIYAFGAQMEYFPFTTSLIPSSAGVGNRSADSLTFTTAQYDDRVCSAGGRLTFYPYWAHNDLQDSDERWLLSFGDDQEGLRVRKTSGSTYVECVSGGSVALASGAITCAKHEPISLEFSPTLGTLTVAGALSGNGTFTAAGWGSWTNTNLRYGGVYGGTDEAYARITNTFNIG